MILSVHHGEYTVVFKYRSNRTIIIVDLYLVNRLLQAMIQNLRSHRSREKFFKQEKLGSNFSRILFYTTQPVLNRAFLSEYAFKCYYY